MPGRKFHQTDWLTVVLHWCLVATLGVAFLTGLRVSIDRPTAGWITHLESVLPMGKIVEWHLVSGLAITIVTVAYLLFIVSSGLKARIFVKAKDLHNFSTIHPRRRVRLLNVLIYWFAFTLISVSIATGITQYLLPSFVPQNPIITIHRYTAWMFLLFIAIHVASQIAIDGPRQLIKILLPRSGFALAACMAIFGSLASGYLLYKLERSTLPRLTVHATNQPPTLDGYMNDSIWLSSDVVHVHTARGVGLQNGEVTVEVRALRDEDHLYTLFRWQDPTRSQKHLPLIKTKEGWQVHQTEYDLQDEDHYYEDKFAVMWSKSNSGPGGGSIQLGSKPLENARGPKGGRGLHYTTDGSLVDVWHWKSVRTGSTNIQQFDDNYFGPPKVDDPKKGRYTGGYSQDPSHGGGYEMNWQRFDENKVIPKWLPNSPRVLNKMDEVVLDPDISDTGEYWMSIDEVVPYHTELDKFAIGTIMPSVVIKGKRQGDRGDVTAVSSWTDGWWCIESKRKLNTGSAYDVEFAPGATSYLWVSAFDHSQTRHSYHFRPVAVDFN